MADSRGSDSESDRRRSLISSNRRKNEAMNVIFTDPQILDCYICCERLSIPVFQCENGHISCSSCCTKIQNKCPSCNLAIGNIRCRAIEKVLESIKIPCRNAIYGCKMTMSLNEIDHETSCTHEPCFCPLDDCTFVGSAEKLSLHFSKKHKNTSKSFSYNARFTMCLNNGDSHRILQAENDSILFVLSYSFEIFGNAVTVNRIGPLSSERKFCYEIKAKTQGSVLCFQSIAKEIQGWSKVPPSKGWLLIPNEYFGSSTQTILEIRIWPAC
ncbi:E3 ubiquitin-protein ligase SINA-like 10 [Benincasa hispida]|uniref:E3 ubiquitin-protein ligase SINA-like 10 n=1 Tax=Benincasa hispida TaxID=102211 RepID=UPI0019026566|nr:E3 ubiquitin-protein ligase SINA-like 10 [Benincasa hispida]XP_038893986.1 E3 ubiquitin-protein ligase SINA-like 10 [Benincasa hispida]